MSFILRFSKTSVQDIKYVLQNTLTQFGNRKHEEYKSLIRDALAAIAIDPTGVPSKRRTEIAENVFTHHIGRRRPRASHFFLYRIGLDGGVDIARFLHDSMDLGHHLPESFEKDG